MMTSRKTIQTLRDRNQSKKLRSRDRGRKLLLEMLEDRRLLASLWVNDNWNLVADNGTVGVLDANDVIDNLNDHNPATVTKIIGTDLVFGTVTTGTVTGALPGGTTIQSAVTAASSPDTINVLEGAYTGAVYLDSTKTNVTLQSSGGAGATAITGPFINMSVGGGSRRALVGIDANGATIDGFTINCDSSTTQKNVMYVAGSSVQILNNTVTAAAPGSSNPSNPDYGILVAHANALTPATGVTISGNTVHGFSGGTAIMFGGTYYAQNGTAQNNTVYNNAQYGIAVDRAPNTTVVNNNVYGNISAGIYIRNSGTRSVAGTVVELNNVYDNPGSGVRLNGSGVAISGVTVQQNAVTTNTTGISVEGILGTGVAANNNIIASNTTGVSNATTTVFDAQNNWWGTVNGPSDPLGTLEMPENPGATVAQMLNAVPAVGLGNAVTENVDYYPWLLPTPVWVDDDWAGTTPGSDPDGGGLATAFGFDAFDTITNALAAVADPGTMYVLNGTYGETLDATGKVLTVNAGSTSAALATAGQVTVSGLTLDNAVNPDTLEIDLNGTLSTDFDQWSVGGAVALGSANLSLTLGFAPSPGDSFKIIDKTVAGAVGGTFNLLPEGKVFSAGGYTFQITYQGGDGNDVVLTTLDAANPVLNGTPAGDYFYVQISGSNLEVYQDTSTTPITKILDVVFTSLQSLTINGLAATDRLTVNFSPSSPIPPNGITFDAGADGAGISLLGNGNTAVYTPDASTTGKGSVVVDGRTIAFDGLQPLDISGMASATITPPLAGANDTLTLTDGLAFFTPATNAIRVTGTTGDPTKGDGFGTPIETVAFFNNNLVVVDTTVLDGADTITIASANLSHANDRLKIETGSGSDDVTINGAATFLGDGGALVDIEIDTQAIAFNGGTLTSSGGTVDLDANNGAITNLDGTVDVVTATLSAAAGTGIDLDTTVTTVSAGVTGNGGILIDESDGVTLTSVTTNNGSITVNAGGTIVATYVASLTDADANDISLTASGAASNINVTTINAGAAGDVTLSAGNDVLDTNSTDANLITADVLTVDAANGTDDTTDGIVLDTTVASLDASVTAGGAGGNINIDETDAIILTDVDTTNGSITVDAGGQITATDVQSAMDAEANDIILSNTSGDIVVGLVSAAGSGDVYLNAAAGIEEDGTADGDADIVGQDIELVATAGIGDDAQLEIDGTNLAATTSTGDIDLLDTAGGLTIADVNVDGAGTSGVTITGGAGGWYIRVVAFSPLTVNSPVSDNAGGNITLAANGTAVTDDVDLNADVTATGGNGDISIYAGDSIDVDGVVTISAAGTGDLLLSASTSYNGGTPANGYNGAVGEAATAGLVLMQDGSVVQSQDGDITLRGDGDVLLSTVNANAAGGTTTVGNVTVAADFDGVGTGMSDGAGEITDNLAGETANVTGYLATLTAASGIGSADDLETNIRNFVARNTTTGDVSVNEVAAGGVLYVLEVTQAGADPSLIVLTTERGSLVLPSPGGLGVSITNSANTSGTILLDANVTQPAIDEASRGDVLVNQVVTSQGGAITINADHDVTGQGDITSNGGAINITADANGNGPGGNNNGTIQLSGDIAAGTGTVTFSLSDCDGEIVGDVDAGNVIMGRDDMVPEGALRLNGTTTVETLTRVDRGALLINGTMTVPDVTVTDNGLLGGNGTITGDIVVQGATSPDVGGILDPGDLNPADCSDPQAGQLTVNGDVDVESGGTFRVQLGGLTPGVGGYDQLVLNGSGNLYGTVLDGAGGGALEVQIVSGYSVPVGGEYIIISNDLTDLIGTRFLGLPEGAFLSPDGVLMNISYLSGTDNNDVTLTAPGRYDFNGFGGHTETNYMPMSPFQEKTGNTAGWEGTLPWYFERFSASDPGWDQLRYDGQSTDPMGNPLTFAVDVVPGKAYEVMILTGDASWNHDLQQFQVYDGNGAVPPDYPLLNALPTGDTQLVDVWGAGAPDGSGVQVTWGGGAANPSAGYYRWVRFTTDDISDGGSGLGSLLMKMLDRGGSSGTTVILAMDIRPVDAVGELTLTGTPFSVLPADGMTVDTYTGTGAPPNAVLTVTVSAGSPLQYATVTPDAVPAADAGIPSAVNAYAPTFGGQVKSDADGNFTFSVTRPATLTVNAASEDWTIVVEESSGLSRGTAIQPYEAPSQAAPLRFDFGATTSPVQTDFLQVVPQTIYNATRGYGWATRVAAGDRRDPTTSALRTDFNSGRNATFKVDVPDGTYNVRLYHSNPLYFGRVPYNAQFFTVDVEGTQYDVDPALGIIDPGETYIHELSVAVTDGQLNIVFGVASTAFMIAGIDISAGALPTDTPLVAAGDPLDAGAAAIGVEQLQSVAAEAAAWWTATGLTPAQAASLAGVQYAVADLGGAYLGLANPATNTIRIDDDAAMFGWSLVTGHSSLVTGHWSLDDAQMTNDKEPMTHDGVSLLTVVRHELGHLLGYEHSDDPDDLMAPVLSASPARAASSPFALDPSALTLPPSGTSDAVFADWGQDDLLEEEGDEAGQLQRLPSQSPDLLAAVLVQSGEDAEEAAVPRRSRLQRYERDLDAWFTELAAESQEGEG